MVLMDLLVVLFAYLYKSTKKAFYCLYIFKSWQFKCSFSFGLEKNIVNLWSWYRDTLLYQVYIEIIKKASILSINWLQ